MSGWSNQPIAAALVIIESVSESGLFVYSGPPGLGDLVASIAAGIGPQSDPFGNTVIPVVASYLPNSIPGGTLVASMNDGSLLMEMLPGGAFSSDQAATVALLPTLGGQQLLVNSGRVNPGDTAGRLVISDSGIGGGTPELFFNGFGSFLASAAGGQMLTVQNTHSAPGNSNLELIGAAAADNMIGVMVAGDTFNRIKITTDRLLGGSGAATQDTQLYRSAVSQWSADTITANVAGSSEVWHSLGTLAGATVNKGRYRFLPDGEVKVEIDVTFGVATAVPITFSNTLPAAYQPPGSVDVRQPAAQTNGAGGFGRFFVGSVGGGSAGQVQIAALANVIGTYSAYFSYSIL